MLSCIHIIIMCIDCANIEFEYPILDLDELRTFMRLMKLNSSYLLCLKSFSFFRVKHIQFFN